MAQKAKSFFGKITGGNVAQEEAEVPIVEEAAQDAAETLEELEVPDEELLDEEEAIIYEEEAEVPIVEEEYEEEVITPAVSASEEEWMNDFEGALNIDMYQTKDNVIIKSTIAGVRPKDIDITVANDMVTIKGTREREEKIKTDDYFYEECYWGGFARSVIIPVDIDSEAIEADLKAGILTIVIPKAAKAKTKKIKVKGL